MDDSCEKLFQQDQVFLDPLLVAATNITYTVTHTRTYTLTHTSHIHTLVG